ncbi:MAG: ImmA/IrrE family metallo-endopeptidase [Actinobacteria bacterium]|nr:ImmA/IrrE family metallo-endopeptidase [Actinomycetota bacterium]
MRKVNLSITIGENIKKAIKESNLSQGLVSKKINISRQTLNNYINGVTLIDFEKLLNIANLTNRSVDFFYKTNQLFGNYKFRSDISIDSKLKIKFEESIRKYDEIEKINKIFPYHMDIGVYLDKFDKEYIATMAEKIRCLFEIDPNSPIANPIYELEKNDIKIIQFRAGNRDVSGFSAYDQKSGYCIFLNSECNIERRFFTAVNELGHLIFHKDDYQGDIKVEKEKVKEDIANEFAGLFLVPAKALKEFCKENFIEKVGFEDVLSLKKYFNVSAKCIIKRLLNEEVINKEEYEELNNKIDSKVGSYEEYEPIEEERNIENYRFINLIKKAFLKEEITISKIAELLEIPVEEANKKALEWG